MKSAVYSAYSSFQIISRSLLFLDSLTDFLGKTVWKYLLLQGVTDSDPAEQGSNERRGINELTVGSRL